MIEWSLLKPLYIYAIVVDKGHTFFKSKDT